MHFRIHSVHILTFFKAYNNVGSRSCTNIKMIFFLKIAARIKSQALTYILNAWSVRKIVLKNHNPVITVFKMIKHYKMSPMSLVPFVSS